MDTTMRRDDMPSSLAEETLELTPATSDYEVVERAIVYIASRAPEQPTLAQVAAAAGFSEFHFQKLFTRWVGISPKRFLQHLTLEEARRRLAASQRVLDVAFDVGLSGPARLHDLFVSSLAVTPGEYRRHGEGVKIVWGVHDSPFGRCVLLQTERGVCGLGFAARGEERETFARLLQGWERATVREAPAETAGTVARIFDGDGGDVRLLLRGTPFQIRVWEALLRIPEGATISYGGLAERVGSGPRAVGQAVGANPIALLIPCHRVITSSGLAGNYRWGEARKLALLGRELG